MRFYQRYYKTTTLLLLAITLAFIGYVRDSTYNWIEDLFCDITSPVVLEVKEPDCAQVTDKTQSLTLPTIILRFKREDSKEQNCTEPAI